MAELTINSIYSPKGTKTMSRGIHVVRHNNGWAVRQEHSQRVSSNHRTQQQAVNQARRQAQNEHKELIIHGRDGQIRQSDSHGHDPFPPEG